MARVVEAERQVREWQTRVEELHTKEEQLETATTRIQNMKTSFELVYQHFSPLVEWESMDTNLRTFVEEILQCNPLSDAEETTREGPDLKKFVHVMLDQLSYYEERDDHQTQQIRDLKAERDPPIAADMTDSIDYKHAYEQMRNVSLSMGYLAESTLAYACRVFQRKDDGTVKAGRVGKTEADYINYFCTMYARISKVEEQGWIGESNLKLFRGSLEEQPGMGAAENGLYTQAMREAEQQVRDNPEIVNDWKFLGTLIQDLGVWEESHSE